MTTIYWFSGTGNSLAVTREIARGLDDAHLAPITSVGRERIAPDDVVGIVCPVYFYGLPLAVRDFMSRLDLSRARYVFSVVTSGGFPGRAPALARKLLRRAGRTPDAVYSVTAPGNYVAMYDVKDPEESKRVLGEAKEAAARIARDIRAEAAASVPQRPMSLLSSALFSAVFGRWFVAACRRQDRRFIVTDACTKCGICARICPVGNIALDSGCPRWLGRCEQCFACIHWCPTAAIQIRGTSTAKRGRYHHPDVSVDDIAAQRGGQE